MHLIWGDRGKVPSGHGGPWGTNQMQCNSLMASQSILIRVARIATNATPPAIPHDPWTTPSFQQPPTLVTYL